MNRVTIPQGYVSRLSLYQTQKAIDVLKHAFQDEFRHQMNLVRATAPLFVEAGSGLNDDLNGVERPVQFDIPAAGCEAQVVHSLAKWKRMALYQYDFRPGKGIYTDMNAIRRDEDMDNLHSIYVDQWDWEAVIAREDRNIAFLQSVVRKIYAAIRATAARVCAEYPVLENFLPDEITFVTSQQLEDSYPALASKEREREFVKGCGAAFVIGIGAPLKSGKKHDGRAPDYDDWNLNGDIILYYPPLDCAFEVSSMGVRVDKDSLISQLTAENCLDRLELPFHKALIAGELPLTMGGGIGQSRLSMFLLNKLHIGEVQVSVWDEKNIRYCQENSIELM